jgi:hypothetical protein
MPRESLHKEAAVHSVFLSYSFRNEQDPLLIAVRALIECAGFRVVDGKALDGFRVGPEVQKRIDNCKGIVCVVTPEADDSGWVNAEFFQAVGQGKKRIFVLRHENVNLGNIYQGVATYQFSDNDQLSVITTLAGTLGIWRENLGNAVRAVLLPEEISQRALNENAKCEYRCEEMTTFEESEWRAARLKPIDAAIHAILPEVPVNHTLQVRVTFGNGTFWTSSFIPQHLTLQLKQ